MKHINNFYRLNILSKISSIELFYDSKGIDRRGYIFRDCESKFDIFTLFT